MSREQDFILKAAIAAMQGRLANPFITKNMEDSGVPSDYVPINVVYWAYLQAETMNTERKKRNYLFDHEQQKDKLNKNKTQAAPTKCKYPDWEGGLIVGDHVFDKLGYCSICGEQQKDELRD